MTDRLILMARREHTCLRCDGRGFVWPDRAEAPLLATTCTCDDGIITTDEVLADVAMADGEPDDATAYYLTTGDVP